MNLQRALLVPNCQPLVLPWHYMSSGAKTGVLLLNMGGPRTTKDVQPFLTRLFMDRDIIKLPMQDTLGPWIAKRRSPDIMKKYEEIGGGSPIFEWTKKQGDLLCSELDKRCPDSAPHKPFIGFRYADPLTEDTLEEMENSGIKRAVAFSQYPQYSCTTSGSSLNAIYNFYANRKMDSNLTWSFIDRWFTNEKLVETFAQNIRSELEKSFPDETKRKNVILLFSAHSIPQYVMNRGDPYPSEIAATVHLVMQKLNWSHAYRLVWQSKVGPMPWLQPATEETIKGLVKRGHKNLMLIPIAFVNEHIETLHELDIEYAEEIGAEVGAEKIGRCSAPNDHPVFIQGMADIVQEHLKNAVRVPKQLMFRCPKCTNPTCSKARAWLGKIASE